MGDCACSFVDDWVCGLYFDVCQSQINGIKMGWVFTDEMRFYLHDNETLLEGMIRTQHKDVRFECRQGYCGSCRMTIKAATNSIVCCRQPIACLAQNEVLACCCLSSGTLAVSYQSDDQSSVLFEFAALSKKQTEI